VIAGPLCSLPSMLCLTSPAQCRAVMLFTSVASMSAPLQQRAISIFERTTPNRLSRETLALATNQRTSPIVTDLRHRPSTMATCPSLAAWISSVCPWLRSTCGRAVVRFPSPKSTRQDFLPSGRQASCRRPGQPPAAPANHAERVEVQRSVWTCRREYSSDLEALVNGSEHQLDDLPVGHLLFPPHVCAEEDVSHQVSVTCPRTPPRP
jgi:hypothetical protein